MCTLYSTTRIGNIWYMEPGPAQAEIVYVVLYRLALFPREITVSVEEKYRYVTPSPKLFLTQPPTSPLRIFVVVAT